MVSQFWYIVEGRGTENFGIFYGRLVNFTIIWCILFTFGNFSPVLVCCTVSLNTIICNADTPLFYQLLIKCCERAKGSI
jgi:hypothetical protein